MIRRSALVALLLAAAVPATADAARLTAEPVGSYPGIPGNRYNPTVLPGQTYAVRLVDDAGRDEDVRILRTTSGEVGFVDERVPIETAGPCTVRDGAAVCAITPPPGRSVSYRYEVSLGAGADRLSAQQPSFFLPLAVDMGPGDDLVETGDVRATVAGGEGDDVLRAPASTTLAAVEWTGGPGADAVSGSGAVVTYAERLGPVRVTPDGLADDGTPGEGDQVGADVRSIIGGAGADDLRSSGGPVLGGPGDDTIVGGANGSTISGGPGGDVLRGGPGPDVLEGGDGRDTVEGGGGDDIARVPSDDAPDVLRGGPGQDALDVGSPAPVTVTLNGRADDGRPGEGDDVAADWEDVSIERGRLVGDDGPNRLSNGNGPIEGRGGDDVLTDGTEVDGGLGRDRLVRTGDINRDRPAPTVVDLRDGERDEVACSGYVREVRLRRDRIDRVRGCFPSARPRPSAPRIVPRTGAQVRVVLGCAGEVGCRGRLSLRARGRNDDVTVARAPFAVRAGGRATVVLRLGRRGAERLRASCGRAIALTFTRSPYGGGDERREGALVELARPGPATDRCRRRRDR